MTHPRAVFITINMAGSVREKQSLKATIPIKMSYKIVFFAVAVFAAQANAQISYLRPVRDRIVELGQEFIAPVYEYGQRIPPYVKGIPGKFYEGYQAVRDDLPVIKYFQRPSPQTGYYVPRPEGDVPHQFQHVRPLPADLDSEVYRPSNMIPKPEIPRPQTFPEQVEVPQVDIPEVPVPEVPVPEVDAEVPEVVKAPESS